MAEITILEDEVNDTPDARRVKIALRSDDSERARRMPIHGVGDLKHGTAYDTYDAGVLFRGVLATATAYSSGWGRNARIRHSVPDATQQMPPPIADSNTAVGDEVITSVLQAMDGEAMEMCINNDLLLYVDAVDKMIRSCYRGVEDIKHECVNYPDVPGYQKLCFEIHLASTPDQVQEDEDKLYDALVSGEIPKNKRDFFIFTHQLS